jgi:hypothetical protein
MRGHEDCPFVPALAQLRTEASGGNDSRTLAFRLNLNERQILGLVEWGRKGRYKGAKLPLYFVTSRRQLLSVATTPGCAVKWPGLVGSRRKVLGLSGHSGQRHFLPEPDIPEGALPWLAMRISGPLAA